MDSLQQLVAVLAVFGLLGGSLWWLKGRGMAQVKGFAGSSFSRRAATHLLRRVERLPLSPNTALHLIRLGDRAILIASSPTGCQVVESSPWSHVDSGIPSGHEQ
jgi:Flagellar biosynthesis protein, FliO